MLEITEVTLQLRPEPAPLRAIANVVFNGVFVVHEIRVVRSPSGGMVISMPARKLTDPCPNCGERVDRVVKHCHRCQYELDTSRSYRDGDPRPVIYADYCHPITAEFRRILDTRILLAYRLAETYPNPRCHMCGSSFPMKDFINLRGVCIDDINSRLLCATPCWNDYLQEMQVETDNSKGKASVAAQ